MKPIDRLPESGEFVYFQEFDKTFTLCEVVPQPETKGMINAPPSSGIIFIKNSKDHPNVTQGIIAAFGNPVYEWNKRLFFQEENKPSKNLHSNKEND